jgi:hypothetical protein
VRNVVSGYNISMEFYLTEPETERLPPADTRLLVLRAAPYPDGRRLRIALDLTPFEQKPTLELTLKNSAEQVVAETSIIEVVSWGIEITLHIRKQAQRENEALDEITGRSFTLSAILSFPDLGQIDQRDINVIIPLTTA